MARRGWSQLPGSSYGRSRPTLALTRLAALRPPVASLSHYSVTVLAFAKENKMPLYSCVIIVLLPFTFGRLNPSPPLPVFWSPSSLGCGQPPLRQPSFSNSQYKWPRKAQETCLPQPYQGSRHCPPASPQHQLTERGPRDEMQWSSPLCTGKKKKNIGSLFFQENGARYTVQTLRWPLNTELSRY